MLLYGGQIYLSPILYLVFEGSSIVKIAILNEKSLSNGKELLFENDSLIIDGMGIISIDTIIKLDEKNALTWEPNLQEKIYALYNRAIPTINYDRNIIDSQKVIKKMKKNKNKVNEKQEINRMILWGTTIAILLLFFIAAGIGLYSKYFTPYSSLNIEEPINNSVVETQTVNPVIPSNPTTRSTEENNMAVEPLLPQYNFNGQKAASIINNYYGALQRKDYKLAYSFMTTSITIAKDQVAPNEIRSTAETIDILSEKEWIMNQKNADYKAIFQSSPITGPEVERAAFVTTVNGREIILTDLKNVGVSMSFNSSLTDKIILCWNKFTDDYYIIDLNSVIKTGNYQKTFVKETESFSSEAQTEKYYVTYQNLMVPWRYADNGSKNGVALIYNSKKTIISSANNEQYFINTKWIGMETWIIPQNLNNNLFVINKKEYFKRSDTFNLNIKLNIMRGDIVVSPNIALKF